MRRFWLILLLPFCSVFAVNKLQAKPHNTNDSSSLLSKYEDTLKSLQFDKIRAHTTDRQKLEANTRFIAMLQKALSLPGSFNYQFDSLTTLGRVTSPDKQFRIFTWDVPKDDGTFAYFGFMQSLDPETKKYTLYTLQDQGGAVTNPSTVVYTPDKWMGMLYYRIIPEKYDGKTIYMVLAWQGCNKLISRKIIDVVTFSNKGIPSFGLAVFKKPPPGYKNKAKRIIFQYSASAFMSMNYNSKKNMIVFDSLAPMDDGLTGQYQYYAPTFQVDCLTYKNTGWEYLPHIDARNPANKSDKIFSDPKKGPDMNKKDHDFGDHAIYNPNK